MHCSGGAARPGSPGDEQCVPEEGPHVVCGHIPGLVPRAPPLEHEPAYSLPGMWGAWGCGFCLACFIGSLNLWVAVVGLPANDDPAPSHYLGHYESLHIVVCITSSGRNQYFFPFLPLSTYMRCTEELFGAKISFELFSGPRTFCARKVKRERKESVVAPTSIQTTV
jgi:hypothetical protein